MLEASVDDIEVVGNEYRVKGSPEKKKTLQEIAFALDLGFSLPEGMEPYLDETAYHDTPNCTWPFGTHIAVVEVDEETGKVDLVRYVAVDDVGKKINPMIVDGQLHGGIAQGVGQALWEEAVYGDDGQLLSGLDARLRAAAGVVAAEPRARRDGHAVAGQPARGQGRRRGRHDRQHGGRRQRGHRRARARSASATSTCRSPRRRSGARCTRRRPSRDPGRVRLRPSRRASPRRSTSWPGAPGSAKVLAGGQSLLGLMRLRLARPERLVDIGGLAELRGIRELPDGGLAIGALATYREVLDSDLATARASRSWRMAIPDIGDVQVRNRGTLGGSIAHADPASDMPAVVLALDARIVAPLARRRAGRPRRPRSSRARS